MRKPSIPDLIYQRTFPKPKQGDPGSFYAHIHRHIVSEIRIEVQTYFGTIDTLEAQYPGLDYTYPAHRHRLSRHAWHRRLFRVFDELGLTNDEILSLCQWEGTRAAKERYEREAQTEVKTTIGADIPAAPRGDGPRALWEDWTSHRLEQRTSDSDAGVEVEEKELEQQTLDSQSGVEFEEKEEDKHDAQSQLSEGESPGPDTYGIDPDFFRHTVRSRLQAVFGGNALLNQAREQLANSLASAPSEAAHGGQGHSHDELHTMVDELHSDDARLAAGQKRQERIIFDPDMVFELCSYMPV